MNGSSHNKLTQKIIDLVSALEGENIVLKDAPVSIYRDLLGQSNKQTDDMHDLEFVDVDMGKDDPHVSEFFEDSDEAHYTEVIKLKGIVDINENFTSYNHFIDIKKGPGLFDDFDGYSYNKGSAKSEQYESTYGMKLDAGIMYWFNDEYVHAPGREWYRNCSPSVFRYCFFNEKGIYSDKYQELKNRFPLADNTGKKGKGIPYSVFMPVDNLGRYWYESYLLSGNPSHLGRVLHAVQDVAVPHHVTSYTGNWHRDYENSLADVLDGYSETTIFTNNALRYFNEWNRIDTDVSEKITIDDMSKTPAINWRIDHLITWLALHAYDAYDSIYNRFSYGFTANEDNMKHLIDLAGAMSLLVLKKASGEFTNIPRDRKVTTIIVEHTTSKESNANTDADFDLYIYNNICGGSVEIDFPDNPDNEREKGKTDIYTFNVDGYNIDSDLFFLAIANKNTDGWLPSKIKIQYTTQDQTIHTYAHIDSWPSDKWFDGDDKFCHEIPKNRNLPADVKVKKLTVSHVTSSRRHAETDADFTLILKDNVSYLSVPFPDLPYDEREKRIEDVYTFDLSMYSLHVEELRIGIYNTGKDGWLPKSFYVTAETEDGTKTELIDIPEWPDHHWFDQNDGGVPLRWLN